jgi:hypothetical protein
MRYPSAEDIFVRCSYKLSVKNRIHLISLLAHLSQRRNCASSPRRGLPQAGEDFHSSEVQYYLRYPTFTAVKISIAFNRQNMVYDKTNQTSRKLPEQINIF